MPVEQRALTSDVLWKKLRRGDWHEPDNTRVDPDASEKALSQGEGRAGISLLPTLRQDISRRCASPCLCSGASESRRAGCRRLHIRADRSRRVGRVVNGFEEGTARQDVPGTTGAAGDAAEAGWRRAATGDSDHTGPSGAASRQAGAGTDLRGGPGAERLWVSSAAERARRDPASA